MDLGLIVVVELFVKDQIIHRDCVGDQPLPIHLPWVEIALVRIYPLVGVLSLLLKCREYSLLFPHSLFNLAVVFSVLTRVLLEEFTSGEVESHDSTPILVLLESINEGLNGRASVLAPARIHAVEQCVQVWFGCSSTQGLVHEHSVFQPSIGNLLDPQSAVR